jgi:hypothetical protein
MFQNCENRFGLANTAAVISGDALRIDVLELLYEEEDLDLQDYFADFRDFDRLELFFLEPMEAHGFPVLTLELAKFIWDIIRNLCSEVKKVTMVANDLEILSTQRIVLAARVLMGNLSPKDFPDESIPANFPCPRLPVFLSPLPLPLPG